MKLIRISPTPAALFAGVLLFTVSACARKNPPALTPVASIQIAKYTVRGVIEELPDASRKGAQELQVHHENIPTFTDKDGKIVGMHSMIMGFPPGPGLTVPNLQKGDKVELDFEVIWTGKDPFYFTAIRKLPADTTLDFSK